MKQATFAAGCFWGIEATFANLKGVANTCVGYCGGTTEQPSYQQVCSGQTGHAEAVRVEFDPAEISYDELLETFWQCHTPTSWHKQGPDVGSQYRSVIFYHDAEQSQLAEQSKQRHSVDYQTPIVTEIVPLMDFYRAEEYHQRYLAKHGENHCGS